MDEYNEVQNKMNQNAAVESCMKHGYRLSLQVHKIIGVA
jgi:organic radical activating enzyme